MTAEAEGEADSAGPSVMDMEKAKLYVDVWKQTVEVQKHFNDLEWRIRGLALTAATFALGASAIAARDGTTIGGISLGAVVLLAGVLLWHAFYFADRYWYHPLLMASVRHGEQLETELRTVLPRVGLTHDITAGSPSKSPFLWRWRKGQLHSSDKLLYFYVIGGAVLVLAALLLQTASWVSPKSPPKGGIQNEICCSPTPSQLDQDRSPRPPTAEAPAATGSPSVSEAVKPAVPPSDVPRSAEQGP